MPVSLNNTTLTFNDATTQTTSAVTSVTAGTGISVTGGKTPTVTNTGVTSVTAGSGISVSSSTGGVTISASGGGYTGARGQVFNSSGTFTIPTGVSALKVTVLGGGAGQAGFNPGCCGNPNPGNPGGASSVSSGNQGISAVTANGGAINGTNGNGSGGALNFTAGNFNGIGCTFGGGVSYGSANNVGSGGTAIQFYTGLTPGANLAVTRGAGGNAGAGNGGPVAGQGGYVLIEW